MYNCIGRAFFEAGITPKELELDFNNFINGPPLQQFEQFAVPVDDPHRATFWGYVGINGYTGEPTVCHLGFVHQSEEGGALLINQRPCERGNLYQNQTLAEAQQTIANILGPSIHLVDFTFWRLKPEAIPLAQQFIAENQKPEYYNFACD